MEIGIVGLGRMGANIARQLMRSGHSVVVFDVNADAVTALYERFRSRLERDFADRLLSAMRNEFGGHVEGHPSNPAKKP
jgi:6-phosphogluconate dehydrogenase (decarboxylating)